MGQCERNVCWSRRLTIGAVLALVAAFTTVSSVSARQPTDTVAHYAPLADAHYDYGTGATSAAKAWLRDSFNTTASNYWPIGNDKAPLFSYDSSLEKNWVMFVAPDNTGRPDECPVGGGWEACAAYDGANNNNHWDLIAFNNGSEWCQETGFNSGCNDIPRAALHELGHMAGMARGKDGNTHNDSGEDWTVVQTGHAPTYGNSGWNTHHMQPCDVLGLALAYDVYTFPGGYPDCAHHIPNNLDGLLKTKVAKTTGDAFACPGDPVTFAGTAQIETDATNYRELSANPLWGRSIVIQRRSAGTSTWSTYATVLAQANGTGTWSKSVTATSGSYEFRGRFAGEAGLHDDNSGFVTITWQSGTC
jgi:hypothetical protein